MGVKVDTIQNPSSATVNLTLDTSGNATVGNNLAVTGTSTFTGSLGNITAGTITASGLITGATGALYPLVQNTSRITLASTATVISTAIPSWAKRIILNIVGMSTSGTSHYIVQIGSGSYTSTGYLGAGSVLATSGATSAFTTGFGVVNNNGASTVSHLTMTLNLQNAATNTWSESHAGAYSNLAVSLVGGGSVSLGGTLDRLQITTVNGTDTFTAGTINFQYE